MATNSQRPTITYENIALVQSDTPCHTTAANSGDSLSFLPQVEAVSFSFNFPRTQQGGIGSRDLYTNSNWRSPDVNFNISAKEDFGNLFSNFLATGKVKIDNLDVDRNFYALIHDKKANDILDRTKNLTEVDVLSFGNCFLTDVSLSQSVPGFLQSEYSFVGSNIQAQRLSAFTTGSYSGGSGKAPSFNLTGNQLQDVPVVFNKIPADSPGSFRSGLHNQSGKLIPGHGTSITLSNENTIAKIDSIQSFSLSLPISRKSIYGIGKTNPVTRKSIFPSVGSLDITNFVSNFNVTGIFSNIKDFLVKDDTYDITLNFRNLKNQLTEFNITQAKLNTNDYSMGIGEALTCDISFSFGINSFSKPLVDSDGDGVFDHEDAFPNDASETLDSDGDGVGDNADAFPNNASETADTDGDGVGDNADAFPSNASETTDTDGDGVGDNADAFPSNASETTDTDGDGVGDNADAFPNDPTRSALSTTFRYYRFLGTNSDNSATTSKQGIMEIHLIDDAGTTFPTSDFANGASPDSGGNIHTGPYTGGGITVTAGYSQSNTESDGSATYGPHEAFGGSNMWWTLSLSNASLNHLTVDFGSTKTLSQIQVQVNGHVAGPFHTCPKIRILASDSSNFSSFTVWGEIDYQSNSNIVALGTTTVTVNRFKKMTVASDGSTSESSI